VPSLATNGSVLISVAISFIPFLIAGPYCVPKFYVVGYYTLYRSTLFWQRQHFLGQLFVKF
jgi:hypothetical protein